MSDSLLTLRCPSLSLADTNTSSLFQRRPALLSETVRNHWNVSLPTCLSKDIRSVCSHVFRLGCVSALRPDFPPSAVCCYLHKRNKITIFVLLMCASLRDVGHVGQWRRSTWTCYHKFSLSWSEQDWHCEFTSFSYLVHQSITETPADIYVLLVFCTNWFHFPLLNSPHVYVGLESGVNGVDDHNGQSFVCTNGAQIWKWN